MKNLQRKQQFDHAQVDRNGLGTLYSSEPGGVRKIRCPKDGGIASPQQNSSGQTVYVCASCGTVCVSRPL